MCPLTRAVTKVMDYFRAAYLRKELSERSLELTEKALALNAANYTAWYFRRLCLFALRDSKSTLKKEFEFIAKVASQSPKNYQLWYHRRRIVEKTNDPSRELEASERCLLMDAKNYHAWSHRQWVLETFALWEHELTFVEKLLKSDPRNNSAWNQRWFVLSRTKQLRDKKVCLREIEYALKHIRDIVNNESPFAYLRGFFEGGGPSDDTTNLSQSFKDVPIVEETVERLLQTEGGKTSAPLIALKIDILIERRAFDEAALLCDIQGSKTDVVRKKYWAYVKRTRCCRRDGGIAEKHEDDDEDATSPPTPPSSSSSS